MLMKYSALVVIASIIYLGSQVFMGDRGVAELYRMKEKITMQQLENDGLQSRNTILSDKIVALQNNVEIIEEYARSELGMIKNNENLYYINRMPVKR